MFEVRVYSKLEKDVKGFHVKVKEKIINVIKAERKTDETYKKLK